jgi:hypothetical protein
VAEPINVRELADHVIIECQSTANALAVRLGGKTSSTTLSRPSTPDRQTVRA